MKYLILSLCILAFSVPSSAQTLDLGPDPNPVDFGPKEALNFVTDNATHTFQVEIADSREKQRHGFMFKENLPDDEGMLFEFSKPAVQTIWMKNTPIPLDVIFVRGNGKILKIEHNHKPYTLRSVSSEAPVAAVVEILGGRARELGIEPGDIVRHEFFANVE